MVSTPFSLSYLASLAFGTLAMLSMTGFPGIQAVAVDMHKRVDGQPTVNCIAELNDKLSIPARVVSHCRKS